jgi:hypothetical protein
MTLPERFREVCGRRRAARAARAPIVPERTPPAPPEAAALPAPDLDELEAQAKYHRDRLALYRARTLSARPTSSVRLRDLQRASAAADARLRHARLT